MDDRFMIKILLFIFIFTTQLSVHAYELLSYKTTISPGCEGGFLRITESHILSSDELTILNAQNDDTPD